MKLERIIYIFALNLIGRKHIVLVLNIFNCAGLNLETEIANSSANSSRANKSLYFETQLDIVPGSINGNDIR